MPSSFQTARAVLLASLALVLASAPHAAAQNERPSERSPETLLTDFIHYVKIANIDLAAGEAAELLGRDLDPIEFVELVEESGELERFESAVASALRVPALRPLAEQLDVLYTEGKLAQARDPEQIRESIDFLDGTIGQRIAGRERLIAAGEYAMPQLLMALLDPQSPALRAEAQRVMIALGRQAVAPLSAALPELDPARQELVVIVLSEIPYKASAPRLAELAQRSPVEATRSAAARALSRLGFQTDADPSLLHYALAEGYYEEAEELTSFPGEQFQLLWTFDPGLGLIPTPIRSEVYHEAMAMRHAEEALRLDPTDEDALALWIAANFSREIDTPSPEYVNPVYGSDSRDAEYFAVAAGSRVTQLVLARGLSDGDTPVVRRAIDAIRQTAGIESLISPVGGTRPMIEALAYPDRRVQVEAALAMAASQPRSRFDGAERVVPILAGAVRNAGDRFAVVLTGADREEYDRIARVLTAQGYQVLPPADRGLVSISRPITETPGIDLVVISGSDAAIARGIGEVRDAARLSVAPILALAPEPELRAVQREFGREQGTLVRGRGISETELASAADLIVEQAAGGRVTEAQAREFSARAIAALRDLAVARNDVLDVSAAATQLIAALSDRAGRERFDIAEVLSFIGEPRVQVAIMDAALDAGGPGQTELLGSVADSAKRLGNMLEPRQVTRLAELSQSPDQELATAAAAAMGALQLPNDQLVPLLLRSAQDGRGERARR